MVIEGSASVSFVVIRCHEQAVEPDADLDRPAPRRRGPGGEWRDIDGTGETTTTLEPFEVVELRTRLVG